MTKRIDNSALNAKYKELQDDMVKWRDERMHGRGHRVKWQRALNVVGRFNTEFAPMDDVMTVNEAEKYAVSRWGKKRWMPVYEMIVEFESEKGKQSTSSKKTAKTIM